MLSQLSQLDFLSNLAAAPNNIQVYCTNLGAVQNDAVLSSVQWQITGFLPADTV